MAWEEMVYVCETLHLVSGCGVGTRVVVLVIQRLHRALCEITGIGGMAAGRTDPFMLARTIQTRLFSSGGIP